MQKPPIPIGSGALGQDPICKNLQFPSDLARSAKIRYAKTSNSHRIWRARPRSDMQKPPIPIGSGALGQDPICKNLQFPSDLARSDPICKNLQFPSDLARSAKIRYAKTVNFHRIRANYRICFALSDPQNGFIGSFWHGIGSGRRNIGSFGVKYKPNIPSQGCILPIQDTLSYNLGEISDLSFQSALCIQARF